MYCNVSENLLLFHAQWYFLLKFHWYLAAAAGRFFFLSWAECLPFRKRSCVLFIISCDCNFHTSLCSNLLFTIMCLLFSMFCLLFSVMSVFFHSKSVVFHNGSVVFNSKSIVFPMGLLFSMIVSLLFFPHVSVVFHCVSVVSIMCLLISTVYLVCFSRCAYCFPI